VRNGMAHPDIAVRASKHDRYEDGAVSQLPGSKSISR
jgi:hypothetical protein